MTIKQPPRPKLKKKGTLQDLADIREALDLAHDVADDHKQRSKVTFDKANRALDRIATALFVKTQ